MDDQQAREAACPFCKRIGDWNVEQSYSMTVVRFEPLNPVTPGHMLFVPVRHAEHPDAEAVRSAMSYAESYAGERGEDFNLITSSGSSATQTVPHIHVHYVPRRKGDGLALPWTVAKAALPVASRSDIPERSRQANEEQIVEALANRLGEHPAAFNVFDITDEATTGIKLNEPVEELAAWLAPSVAALVSSPSEISAAPKETVTPAREAILRDTVIREVLDWIDEQHPGIPFLTRAAREHFGVSS